MQHDLKLAETNPNCDKQLIDACKLLCEYAEKRLPDGYFLNLTVQRGESSLHVCDPDGDSIEFESDRDVSSWRSAIEKAWEHEASDETKDGETP